MSLQVARLNSIWWSLEKSRLGRTRTNRHTVNKPSS